MVGSVWETGGREPLDSDEFRVQNSCGGDCGVCVWHLSPTWNADDVLRPEMAAGAGAGGRPPTPCLKACKFSRLGRDGQSVGIDPDVILEEEIATRRRVSCFGHCLLLTLFHIQ